MSCYTQTINSAQCFRSTPRQKRLWNCQVDNTQ